MLNTKKIFWRILKNQTVVGPHWLPLWGKKYYGSQWGPSTVWLIQFNSIHVYLFNAFHDTNHCKAALQKILRFYITFRSRLLVVTMAEIYSKNHAVSYKLHVIKQTVNTINCNDYMLWLNIAIKKNLVVLPSFFKTSFMFDIRKKLNRFGMAWGWVNDDRFFIFEVNYSFNSIKCSLSFYNVFPQSDLYNLAVSVNMFYTANIFMFCF